MQKSRLYLIAGKTGAGKSVFSINLVKNFLEQGKSVMLFTLENTAEETMDRLI
jgi:KaiC/GvpD/RAD55 family RecA-like ATPase